MSKENEIKRLNSLIEDMKKGSITQEMEENFKKEKEKLLSKINNLELKIYNINDEKNKLDSENKKLNEKLNAEANKEKEKEKEKDSSDNNKDNKDKDSGENNKDKDKENNDNNKDKENNENTKDNKEKKSKKGKKSKGKKNNDEENKENKENKENNDTTEEKNEKDNKDNKQNENDEEYKKNYEELVKMKEDIEEQNKKLIEEINSLKASKKDKKNKKDKKDENENSNENNSNNEEELKNKIQELQNLVEDYKTGKIISEHTKKMMNSAKNDEFDELKKKYDLLNTKNKNNESKIKSLNDNITNNNKNKKDLETIVLKQENTINELNTLLRKKENSIHSKEASISKNEAYSLQLMNIIKEQKLQIQNMKKQKKEDELSQIAELKRQINNLENTIEVKDSTISNMKKNHKNLQDKYIKLCFKIKNQESDNLLYQAKMLKQQKLSRDAKKLQNSYKTALTNNNNKIQFTEDSNTFSEMEYPNLKTNSNINAINNGKEKQENKTNEIILPVISPNNSVKIEDNYISNKDISLMNEGNKLDEINEMMKKVIDEN